MNKLETKINSVSDKMAKKTQKPLAEAMRQHELARERDERKKKEEANKLREEMEKRKKLRLEEQMKQEDVARKLEEALVEK